jgi:pimeloyl-ACP methyl ester carboxylesterase
MILNSTVHSRHSDKPALLLIHGMGSASSAWKPIIGSLLNSFTVITVDLPGHGESKLDPAQEMNPEALAQAVLETMQVQDISEFHVVGNSLGGWIAFEIAVLRPSAVLSIVALAPAGLWLVPFRVRYPGTAVARMMASSLKLVSPVLLRYEWARKIGFSDVSPRWREYSYELCLDATNAMAKAAGYYPAWDALLKKRFDKKIDSSISITIIFGDTDKTLPKETCQERSLSPSHATWITYERAGHAPMWDYPEKVIEQIIFTTASRR